MTINPNSGAESLPESGRVRNQDPARPSASSYSSTSWGEDHAQLSGAHVQVQALAARALQLPEVRHERISALRRPVLGGTYQPDAEQVADALLTHMLVKPAA